ncbi:hypothetical protein PS627_00061 [Pseudomonas fluorescens]|uniref:hypothetical protein n=1 Tax=Pseudomonas fluorescens TaxID=294 RepID=UPI0012515382|nr:hypothetical protein [Pseudomonas fluorescens]CAG8863125.1 hypothetical protein PS627_00061 [Pseudomonas fluorescens]
MTDKPSNSPIVIDEAYMEQLSNDQLVYKAWIGADLVQEILFSEEACEDSLHEAKCEAAYACIALRVLVRRLTGMQPDELRQAVLQRQMEVYVLGDDVEQLPAWETLQ